MKPNRSASGDVNAANAEVATARAAAQANQDKIDLISQGLDADTLLRARRFGVRPLGVNMGGPTTSPATGIPAPAGPRFGGFFGRGF